MIDRVMLVPALGAMVLTLMLYLAPSKARARENPRIPSFYLLLVGPPVHHQGSLTYRRSIVGLSEVAVNSTGACGVDNATILVLQHVRPSSLGDLVGSAQVNVNNRVPQIISHVSESLVSENTSVVDQNIDTTVSVDGGLDNSWAILARGLVAHGLSTELLDLLDNRLGVNQVVNHNLGAKFGELKAVSTAKTGCG